MPELPFPKLDVANWRFDEIEVTDPDRALRLEQARPPEALIGVLRFKLSSELKAANVRLGRECRESGNDYRAVIQFHIGTGLFDWFFNGRTGYRAQYRAASNAGLAFNEQIITTLNCELDAGLSEICLGRALDYDFNDCGEVEIPKTFIVKSLAPHLAKTWWCGKLIEKDGRINALPSGVEREPRIGLSDCSWPTIYRNDDDAWLDIKGAFFAHGGWYQPKDPVERAIKLQTTGEA
jgi:hypothetical protein